MSASDQEGLTPDDVFDILSNHRRRMVLYFLRQNGDSVTVNDLAEQIAARENEVPIEELTSQRRKRVYVSLYQTHLPKMADMNLIEYDSDEGMVQQTDRTWSVDQFLTTNDQAPYPWLFHYAVLAILSAGLMISSLTNVPVLGDIPIILVSFSTLFVFVVSGSIQYWVYRQRQAEIPFELIEYNQ